MVGLVATILEPKDKDHIEVPKDFVNRISLAVSRISSEKQGPLLFNHGSFDFLSW